MIDKNGQVCTSALILPRAFYLYMQQYTAVSIQYSTYRSMKQTETWVNLPYHSMVLPNYNLAVWTGTIQLIPTLSITYFGWKIILDA